MPVRSSTKRPVKRRSVRRAPEESPEIQAAEIRHHHNMIDLKVAIALAFVVVSSMVINVYAKSPVGGVATASSATGVVPASTGRLLVSPNIDYHTVSRIITPTTSTPATLAKWTVAAEVEPVKLKRVRFNVINGDYTVRTSASEFGQFSLFENFGTTPIATSVLVGGLGNGYVEFNLSDYEVNPGQPRVLVLKSTINGSGIMKENSMIRFGVTTASAGKWQAVGTNSGQNIESDNMQFGAASYGVYALSALHLYHNAAPLAFFIYKSEKLQLNSQANVFSFGVSGMGDRELRLSKLLVNISASGMANSGITTTTGAITKFKLYEANSNDQIGTHIASATGCLVSPKTGGAQTGTVFIPRLGTCNIGNIFLTFDKNNDVNGLFDSFTVPMNGSRRFIVVADTTNVLNGKMSGSVSVVGKISGGTGTFPSSDPKKPFWSGGGIFYHYTPVLGKENVNPYNQSDSYPVIGYPLTLNI